MHSFIIGLGELLWDIFPNVRKIGGAPANFAYHTAQFGLNSMVVSAIGKDELGKEIIELFNDNNINSIIEQNDFPTGTVYIKISGSGIPSYTITENSAWDNIEFNDGLREIASQTKMVCFGSLAQRNKKSRDSIIAFLEAMQEDDEVYKVFDINLRQDFYTKEIIENSFKHCNILKINDEEIEIVNKMFDLRMDSFEDFSSKIMNLYQIKIIIITCGEKGSYVFAENHESYIETPKVIIEDTVGAGDSFTAAFCASILNDKSLYEAHKNAVKYAAFICTQAGAMPVIPEDIKQL